MYYLDQAAFDQKVQCLQWVHVKLGELCQTHVAAWTDWHSLSQERLLEVAMEAVTDVGHMLIDCFMMRDAGSYEDIIEILREENVYDQELAILLQRLVQLKPLLFKQWHHRFAPGVHVISRELLIGLPIFVGSVREFVKNEFRQIGG